MKKLSVSITILFLLVFGLFLNTAVASAQKTPPALAAAKGLPSWAEVVKGPEEFASAEAAEVTAVAQTVCARTITANVVALDQSFFYNRMGAANPAGLIYALRRDVINKNDGLSEAEGGVLAPGQVSLRSDKRPRPLTLRMNVGDCLQINFQNLLDPVRVNLDQPATRAVSIYVNGLQPVNSVADSGAYVGANVSSGVAAPAETTTYTLYAAHEGTYLLHNKAATTGGEGNAGTASYGLFGAVNVEPAGAEWYRS